MNQAESAFTTQLTRAFRGGLTLVGSSILWSLFLPRNQDPFFDLCFRWLPVAWVVFPAGALLGLLLPRLVERCGSAVALATGVLVGIVTGLVLALGFWFVVSHNDLIGLVVNRNSGGYASYSYSIRRQLGTLAWQALTVVAPVTALWVALWTLRLSHVEQHKALAQSQAVPASASGMRLKFDFRLLRLLARLAGGLAVFGIVILLLLSWFQRGLQIPDKSFLIVGPAAVGLVILGPFLGPILTGCDFTWAFRYAGAAVPVLLASLAPFAFCRDGVRPERAVAAWCGFVTALFFWIATGLYSLGRCLG